MADIPTRVRQVIPSGRAPGAFIPFDIADTGQGIEAGALGRLGREISRGGEILAELEIRDRKANDLKQASVDTADRMNSQLAIEEWKNKNPLDQHTAENFREVWDQSNQFDPSKYLDNATRDKAQIISDAERDNFIRSSAIKATDTRIRDTILSTKDAYILEPNQLNRNNYEEALRLMHTEDRVDSLIAVADTVAEKLTEERNETIILDAAFAAWRDTGDLDSGLEIIDRSGLDDKARLENELKTRVTNRKAEEKIALEEQQEADRSTINKVMYVDKDYSAAFDAINNSSLSETEKRPLLKESGDRAKLAASGRSETNDPQALDKVTTAIAQLGNDTLPLAEAKQIFKENSRFLKATTADELWKNLIGEFDASVDTAAARVRSDVKLRAVGKTESALDRLLEALAGVPEKGQKALEDRISTAREKFNLELSNFNRWEEAIRAWRRTNNEATPEQIQKEGMRSWFTEFAGKDIEQLRAEEGFGEVPTKKPMPDLVISTGEVLMRKPPKKRPTSRGGGIIEGAIFRIAPEDVKKRQTEGWKKVSIPDKIPDIVPIERVRVISPEGKTGTVPADKVDELPEGWRIL